MCRVVVVFCMVFLYYFIRSYIMSIIIICDGIEIYYKDWGSG